MFQAAFQLDISKDPVRGAAFFHNRILEIQPFAIQSGGAARMLMQYELIRGGLPPVALSFSPEEYDRAVIAYLRKDDEAPFYSGLLRSIYNTLTLLDRLTKRDSA
jgi:Fic family protein